MLQKRTNHSDVYSIEEV